MVILEPKMFKTKEEYIKSLSERGRHERRYIQKMNKNVVIKQVTELDREKLQSFMELWERQLVRGKPIQWAYPVQTIENWFLQGELILFEANEGDKTLAMIFLKRQDGFWEAGPPMWDKFNLTKRHLGTAMWFWLMEYGVEHQLEPINLGGGIETSWREMIKRRKEFRNPLYKWRFIPEKVKINPEGQRDWYIEEINNKKFLYERV